MTTLVIGDIHGCYVELQDLLDKAGLGDDALILSVGDFVDRGPETPQVLDFFHTHPNAHALMGNHERKHVRAARGEIQLSLSQRISKIQLADRYSNAVEWMGALPLYSQMEEALIVHGFFEPNVPLEAQHPSVLCGTLGGAKILHERYNRPWYELYEGDQPIIVGHQNYTDSDQPFIYKDKVFGLDTSCVLGKSLTGILLPSFRIISVPSRGNHLERVRREYKKAHRSNAARVLEVWSEQDNIALAELIEKVEAANQTVLAKLQSSAGYNQLNPRQQAQMYADMAGKEPAAILMQKARLGNLDLEAARKVVKSATQIEEIGRQFDEM